ncbi:circularly permuted type 2 ATP-grasp protein [Aureimonas populi]|uniref:Circularly permuted type 2 ATP-grasp protein n=1 Tax=Aureimonas populi TaxID=1701758 RepID=A0ABW5CNJ7_9HYPH|nr:circularly permuted type 2 ATP-grasp protein [Aureimonas populi]
MGHAQPAGAGGVETLLAGYRPALRDEMVDARGALRPHYRPLIEALAGFGEAERQARFGSAAQYLREAGVFYRVYDPGEGEDETRAWPLSHPPLILEQGEWQALETGLKQRAAYLERLLADLYGERRVVREGLLPSTILGRNPEFLRPLARQGLPGEPLIRFIGVDLGRGADGRWWVLGDRTQAPSGAGFALENRVATAKAFPELSGEMKVRRLAGFFDGFRRSLLALNGAHPTKVGLLSPGPHNETYFEHAYLARYLGFQLLEGGDLAVTGDEVALRTVEGPAPLSVLWRRLDADFADPLELFSGSAIGTPGLARAVRAGKLHLVNALGSGLLETRALLAYEGALARRLTGEALALPTIATWWCGTPEALAHVGRAPGLTLRAAFPGLSADDPVPAGRLADDPAALVAQESAPLSTAPVFVEGRLEPRAVSLRVFLARGEAGWEVMPGGFARLSDDAGGSSVSMQGGGRTADVWVVSDKPEAPLTLLASKDRFHRRLPGALPARAADNLYWLGRQTERTEIAVRLARLAAARRTGETGETALDRRLDELLGGLLGAGEDRRPGLLVLARTALDIAARIRDRFSPDGWRALSEIVELLQDASLGEAELHSRLLMQLAGFTGLVRENMYQFTGWRFLEIGRQLERGLMTAHVGSRLLDPALGEEGVCEALLEFADSRMTYRRRFSVDLHRQAVIDLAILDPLNPRSLAFLANGVEDIHARLPGTARGQSVEPAGRRLARLCVRLRTAEPAEIDAAFLARVVGDFADISDHLAERYFGLARPMAAPSGEGE